MLDTNTYCDGKCCVSRQQDGLPVVGHAGSCPCQQLQSECSARCGCDIAQCRNRTSRSATNFDCTKDIAECPLVGICPFTRDAMRKELSHSLESKRTGQLLPEEADDFVDNFVACLHQCCAKTLRGKTAAPSLSERESLFVQALRNVPSTAAPSQSARWSLAAAHLQQEVLRRKDVFQVAAITQLSSHSWVVLICNCASAGRKGKESCVVDPRASQPSIYLCVSSLNVRVVANFRSWVHWCSGRVCRGSIPSVALVRTRSHQKTCSQCNTVHTLKRIVSSLLNPVSGRPGKRSCCP